MTIFAKQINVSELLSVSVLSNRATARSLVDEVKKINKSKIKLDFTNVEFASRSFMDELNSLINQNQQLKFIKINMNEQVLKMDELVQTNEENSSLPPRPDKHHDEANLVAM